MTWESWVIVGLVALDLVVIPLLIGAVMHEQERGDRFHAQLIRRGIMPDANDETPGGRTARPRRNAAGDR